MMDVVTFFCTNVWHWLALLLLVYAARGSSLITIDGRKDR